MAGGKAELTGFDLLHPRALNYYYKAIGNNLLLLYIITENIYIILRWFTLRKKEAFL